jgi:hypothetical protein
MPGNPSRRTACGNQGISVVAITGAASPARVTAALKGVSTGDLFPGRIIASIHQTNASTVAK